jgi:hypothetical protein
MESARLNLRLRTLTTGRLGKFGQMSNSASIRCAQVWNCSIRCLPLRAMPDANLGLSSSSANPSVMCGPSLANSKSLSEYDNPFHKSFQPLRLRLNEKANSARTSTEQGQCLPSPNSSIILRLKAGIPSGLRTIRPDIDHAAFPANDSRRLAFSCRPCDWLLEGTG